MILAKMSRIERKPTKRIRTNVEIFRLDALVMRLFGSVFANVQICAFVFANGSFYHRISADFVEH